MSGREIRSYPNATVETVVGEGELYAEGPDSKQNVSLDVLLQWIGKHVPTALDIASLGPDIDDEDGRIEDESTLFIVSVHGVIMKLQGDILADWIADQVTDGTNGEDGDDGWSPVFAIETDGEKRHLKVDDWTAAGTNPGPKPGVGYIGAAGIVAAKADAADIRGPEGQPGQGGTGTPLEAATQAEGIAGTDSTKYITSLVLGEVLEHVRAVEADVTNGVAGKLVDAAVLKTIRDALSATIVTLTATVGDKIDKTDIENVARNTIDDADLSEDVKAAFRKRIGADSEDGEWSEYHTADQRYGDIPGGLGVGPVIPDGSTHIEFNIVAESEQNQNYTVREITVASLLSKPGLNQGDNAITHGAGVIETAFDERDTLTPGADAQTGYLGHNGRTLLYASDQSIGAAIRVRFRETKFAGWAYRDSTEPIPTDRLEPDVARYNSDGKLPASAFRPTTTGSVPPADPTDGEHFILTEDYSWPLRSVVTPVRNHDNSVELPNQPDGVRLLWIPTNFASQLAGRLVIILPNGYGHVPSVWTVNGTAHAMVAAGAPYAAHHLVSAALDNPLLGKVRSLVTMTDGTYLAGTRDFDGGVELYFSEEEGNWAVAEIGATVQQVQQEVDTALDERLVYLTQAAYDALPTKNPSTLYGIIPG